MVTEGDRPSPWPSLALALAVLACGGSAGGQANGPDTPTPTPTPGATCSAGAQACAFVAEHDAARAAATPTPTPPLPRMTWSAPVAAAAEAWARRCVWAHDPELGALRMGQNLFASSNVRTPAQVVASWADEAAHFDYAANRCASGQVCGHYTQIVWRSSTQLGCATAECSTGSPFGSLNGGRWWNVVCNYAPAGNVRGSRPY